MSEARLRELRMLGFKSFAERTVVQFGPGISAVVGPNGSGKSNLADALRWALGEQGRALRTRRAEDLIFAGSANRRAVGMADVSLLIDNDDRLLSVDYGEVELSRRLYRSGENEYLLNRQRIRLRDLVDLLDDANIADNAFLFIGQGMVDQALALRPEERRPLFEEAAGIRKHERRRRKAEADLTEAGSNLERVRDLLAELRPQARRLAAQAQQQQARRTAGTELAEALVVVARARLGALESEAASHSGSLDVSRREADAALAMLRDAEETTAALTGALGERAEAEVELRAALESARSQVMDLRLADARATSEAEACDQRRTRLADELAVVGTRMGEARLSVASVLPSPDHAAEDALAAMEARLAAAEHEAEEARDAGRADAERTAAARATRQRLESEASRAAERAAEAERREGEQTRHTEQAGRLAVEAAERANLARARLDAARRDEASAELGADVARSARSEAETADVGSREALGRLRSRVGTLEAQVASLDRQLAHGPDESTLRSARARGGRRLSDGLEVEPALRSAVEAALGDVMGGLVLDTSDALELWQAAAIMVLRDSSAPAGRTADRSVVRLLDAVGDAGGGPLWVALRRDPDGHGARLLARCAWLPDLEACLRLRESMPTGWRLVTREGEVLDDQGVLRPAPVSSHLERRAERDDVARELEQVGDSVESADADAREAADRLAAAVAEASRARAVLDEARRELRLAEEGERSVARASEEAARESAWQVALLERAATDARAARDDATRRSAELRAPAAAAEPASGVPAAAGSHVGPSPHAHLAGLEQRIADLREERDAVAAAAREARTAAEQALETRRRAEVGLGIAQARAEEIERERLSLAGQEADLAASRERLATELTTALAGEGAARERYEASVASARGERQSLLGAEAAATAARERLRLAEARSRQSEVAEMEARLQFDAAREALLVELAAIGGDGLAALVSLADSTPAPPSLAGIQPADADTADDLLDLLEQTLETALATWRAAPFVPVAHVLTTSPSDAETAITAAPSAAPSAARIGALRRRFHELGAGNPFAATELAEVDLRLTSLEAQREDLERAIHDTRELIARLDTLIAEQFRQTFAALEDAFGRRFHQLFGGGEAQLSLTAPEDLSTTGVEITARPPGKKRQPLAMLSGGERALTAVALLMAMLEVRPVPFCVLDEVDAALDEANVGRFSTALRSLAESIQFIVITHNRGTIEAADALYGVTVGDDAVSRVVSLRLADLAEGSVVDGASLRDPAAVPV